MFRTAMLSAVLAFSAYGCSVWLTHDFQIWTAEGARRLEVALQPITAPAVQIDGPGLTKQALSQILADGRSITLLDFVYTRCRTVCLTLGSAFQQMQATLQADGKSGTAAQRVKLLSLSFDEQYDNPRTLEAYAARLGADPVLWRFARVPDTKESSRLLADFKVVVVPDGHGDFEHNAALLVVDQNGRLVHIFDYADPQLALDYARYLASRIAP
jgi:protein SCO1/2